MMSYVLGLDLGSNSIGWALVDEGARKVICSGVRVFPEGVDRDKQGGEVSKNENRRIKRGMRRQVLRRAARKKALRSALLAAGLLPPVESQTVLIHECDPYTLRAKGLDHRLDPFEFGRALLHLNQRRGFKSNRKKAATSEEKGMLAEISQLAADIAGFECRTLGEYLYKQRESSGPLTRIRGRHTRREMIQNEFDLLWEKQKTFHPDLLTDELRIKIWDDIVGYQRAMYWPASVIGRCKYEKREKRCRRAHPVAEKFRMLQEVNNLRLIEGTCQMRSLVPEERAKLIAYLSRSERRSFDEIRRHLGLLDSHGFNLEFGDRKELLGLPTDHLLSGKKLFGAGWHEIPGDVRDQIVETMLNESITEEEFISGAIENWRLPPTLAAKLAEVDLKPGYSSCSLMAMRKLMPFLEQGMPLSGKPGEPDALHSADYLREDERVRRQSDFLPEPPELTNPLVLAALFQVRQVVNAVIREYGRPSAIHIELARDVKGTSEQRRQQSLRMRMAEKMRKDAAANILQTANIQPRRKDIDRYILWEQQGKMCIYSGQNISLAQLFGGDVDIDHILPYSRCLDDSQLNKVVALRAENQAKGNRTPFEWLAETDPAKYELVLQRAGRLPFEIRNAKRTKFAVRSLELLEFVERQLNDTKYISRKVAEYVKCLGTDVVCTKGQCTAELRHYWGLNTVLRNDGLNLKNREDHRHHAVDALVIALTSRSRLQALARDRGRSEFAPPWEGFRQAAEQSVNAINVSIRVQRRVSGALHEETLYGPTAKPWKGGPETRRDTNGRVAERPWATGWTEETGAYSYRKPLESLTPAMVEEIRDAAVRRLVKQRLMDHGIEEGSKQAIPKSVWQDPLRMPGEKGAIVRKVRLVRRDETIKPIRSGRESVKTGSNHHLCIFEYQDGGKRKREAKWVNMMEAARRIREKETLIRREHPSRKEAVFVMSLSRGELVLGKFKGQERLCVFQTGASTRSQLRFALHTDARGSSERKTFYATPGTLNDARKVTVDPLGRIRWAND